MHPRLHDDGATEPAARETAAERVLGSQHPFVTADRELRQGAAGLALTALFVVVAAAAGYPGRSAAVAGPGTLVLFALLMRVGLLADGQRQRALDLVMAGDETLPIPAVVRLRRSLLGRRRTLTVRRLRHILDDAIARHHRDPAAHPSPILDVREEVAEIVVLLTSTHCARAVAMTTRLLDGGAGWHVLYSDREGLRREFGRILFVLAAFPEPVEAPPAARASAYCGDADDVRQTRTTVGVRADCRGLGSREHVPVTQRRAMKLIVHATDGSPEAAEALDLAIELARDTGAALAVVSVHVVAIGGKGLKPPVSEVEEPHGAEHLAETAAATARAEGVEAKPYAVTGEPARAITELADELGADLIVVGSRGFGALHGALVGSVSRGIITRSKIPVTVVANRGVREPAGA